MRRSNVGVALGAVVLSMALGCESKKDTTKIVPITPEPITAVAPVDPTIAVERDRAREAADTAREQARAAEQARIEAERAAAASSAVAAQGGIATADTTRRGPDVIGYGPSDAIDRAEERARLRSESGGGGSSGGGASTGAGTTGTGGAVVLGGGVIEDTNAPRRTNPGTNGPGQPLSGVGSPGFPTGTQSRTGRFTQDGGAPGRLDTLDGGTTRVTDGGLLPPTADGGGFDGGTRRDGGFADGGQRRPLATAEAPRPDMRTR